MMIAKMIFKDLYNKIDDAIHEYLEQKKDSDSWVIKYLRRKFSL